MSTSVPVVTKKVMLFGKYKGTLVAELNDHYLGWVYSLDDLRPPLRDWVEEEVLRRLRETPMPDIASGSTPPERTTELIEAGFAALVRIYRPNVAEALAARAWLLRRIEESNRPGAMTAKETV